MFPWLFLLLVLCVSACTGIPAGLQPITGFDLNRYLGKWYEIARLDHRFERGMVEVSAEYSLRDDGGVRVINSGYLLEDQQQHSAEGKAYFLDQANIGRLEVSFWGPFYGAYNIIALDQQNYSYVMITGDTRDYLWILSRTPSLAPDILKKLVEDAQAFGFATDKLIYSGSKS